MPVYVIRAGEHGPVKIGFSEDVTNRLVKMQSDNHERLTVLRTFVGGEAEELSLHLRFADQRLHGEWFAFSRLMLGDLGLEEIMIEPEAAQSPPEPEPVCQTGLPMAATEVLRRAGGPSKLARALGLNHSSILGWTSVPPRHVPAVATLLGIGRHEIRPDLWEEPPEHPNAAAATEPAEAA